MTTPKLPQPMLGTMQSTARSWGKTAAAQGMRGHRGAPGVWHDELATWQDMPELTKEQKAAAARRRLEGFVKDKVARIGGVVGMNVSLLDLEKVQRANYLLTTRTLGLTDFQVEVALQLVQDKMPVDEAVHSAVMLVPADPELAAEGSPE